MTQPADRHQYRWRGEWRHGQCNCAVVAPRHHDEGVASLGAVAEGGLVVPRVVVVVAGDNLTRDEVQGGDERRVRGVAGEYLDVA